MQERLFYQIALTQYQHIGLRTAHLLIENFGDAQTLFGADNATLKSLGKVGDYLSDKSLRDNAFRRAEKELKFIEEQHIRTLLMGDEGYPYRLNECSDAPILLYMNGNCNLNDKKYLAIVGTRKISDYGKSLAEKLIRELASANQDIVIISGLAYGVDIASHRAALQHQMRTIGVVAHGHDRIYPSQHSSVARQMIDNGGGILTEYPSCTNPDAPNFVQRNRIVAGICDATIVIESAIKGGSLITAGLANDYNRDVMAFPGRVGDKTSEGCNSLIRDHKAELITSAEDVINIMGWNKKPVDAVQQTLLTVLTPEEEKVIEYLKTAPQHINQISQAIEMPIQKTSALLTEMAFNDLIEQLPGDQYKNRL